MSVYLHIDNIYTQYTHILCKQIVLFWFDSTNCIIIIYCDFYFIYKLTKFTNKIFNKYYPKFYLYFKTK